MVFGQRLKELRIAHGMTQKQLADILNVDQSSIVNWEKSINETDFKTLVELAKLFEVSTDYLLGITDI